MHVIGIGDFAWFHHKPDLPTKNAQANALQAETDRTDKEIDALVYQLYGLTEDEVKVVEGK